VFLLRKQFSEAVSRYLSSRLLLNSDSSIVYFLVKPYSVAINIAKLYLDVISITFNKAHSLHIVASESRLSVKRKELMLR
jgi:hypothetical protein